MGQKICPEKKLENGFFLKIDVAIVGWTSLKIVYTAFSQENNSFFWKFTFFTFTQKPLKMAQNDIFLWEGELKTQIWAILSGFWVKVKKVDPL